VNDPELLRQRRAAEVAPEDPKLLYRYRVLALKAGVDLRPLPGDMVSIEEEDDEARVVRVREPASGPEEVVVRLGKKAQTFASDELRIVSPHRPAVLLGEEELAARLDEDVDDPHDPRALETLGEVARRSLREGIGKAVELFARVEEGPDKALRRVLTKILRSRPFGEVEVDLLHRHLEGADKELTELPALAASGTEEETGREVLDRLEAMDPEEAARVVVRCGRNLVGAGGPAFVDADLRDRVATMSREHPHPALRVALFLHAVPVLQSEEVLVEKALKSKRPEVRAGACLELIRRQKLEPVWEHVAGEEDPGALERILAAAPAPAPLALVERALELGRKRSELEEQALLRLPEAGHGPEALELLSPWFGKKARKTNTASALWAAGMLGHAEAGDLVLGRLTSGMKELPRIGAAVEALIRLGHEAGAPALDAWGVELIEAGPWGEELVDACGLILSRSVDARELLGRFLIVPPRNPVRAARGLEAVRALASRDDPDARLGHRLKAPRLQRFADLGELLWGS